MKMFLILATLSSFNTAHTLNDRSADFQLGPQIDGVLKQHLDEEYNVGAVVGVTHVEETKFGSYGLTALGLGRLPDENTLYEIGSISKVFTGIMLASLVVDGTLSLNDPISKFIPELSSCKTGSITLVELSTHTSGLPRLPTNFAPKNHLDPYKDYSEEDLLKFLKGFSLGQHPIPFSWKNYSNLGVGLLGYVLTRATGKSYEELLLERITGPLKMNDTVVTLSADQEKRFATAYANSLDEVLPWNFNVLVGAGGIRSTIKDLLTFLKANLNPDLTSLAVALKLAQTVHAKQADEQIGLGWGHSVLGGVKVMGHGGGTGGYRAYVGIDSREKKAIAWLTNTASEIQCVDQMVLLGWDCQPSWGGQVPEEILDSYLGSYSDELGLRFIITRRKGHLIYELVGQEKGNLKALSESKFTIMDIATFEFMKDSTGEITHFIFRQGDVVRRFNRQTKRPTSETRKSPTRLGGVSVNVTRRGR